MPDLKSELSKVINQWEAPAAPAPAHFKPTNNVTRTTFNHVRDNPGVTRVAAVKALELQGYKKTSTTSLLVQMLKQGLLREANGALFVAQPEYTPLKQRLVRAAAKRKYAPKVKPVEKAAPQVEQKAEPVAEFDAEEWVNRLTLKQAKAVYEELKKVFG